MTTRGIVVATGGRIAGAVNPGVGIGAAVTRSGTRTDGAATGSAVAIRVLPEA